MPRPGAWIGSDSVINRKIPREGATKQVSVG